MDDKFERSLWRLYTVLHNNENLTRGQLKTKVGINEEWFERAMEVIEDGPSLYYDSESGTYGDIHPYWSYSFARNVSERNTEPSVESVCWRIGGLIRDECPKDRRVTEMVPVEKFANNDDDLLEQALEKLVEVDIIDDEYYPSENSTNYDEVLLQELPRVT